MCLEKSPSLSTSTTTIASATANSKPPKRPITVKTPTNDVTPKPTRSNNAKATPKASTTPSQQLMSPSTEVPPTIIKSIKQEPQVVVTVNDEGIISKDEKCLINDVIEAEQKHTESTFCENNFIDESTTEAPQQQPSEQLQEIKTVVQEAIEIVNEVVDAAEQQNVSIQEVEIKNEIAPVHELILESADMTASMIAKSKITTEEEAKAAIAERRRIAREEAQRQAELERKRLEAEEEAERQKQEIEEEKQRQMEAETIRLGEEQRRAEEERLQQAIEENNKREEEERKRKEREAREKDERDKADKKAREDAERAKVETAERLKKEEAERLERKKRVDEIMARTRKGAAGTPSKVFLK